MNSRETLLVPAMMMSALAGGCYANGPIYVDSRFTPAEQVEIQAAADYWERATGDWAHIDLVFGAHVRLGANPDHRQLVRLTDADIASGYADNAFADPNTDGRAIHVKNQDEMIQIAVERCANLRTAIAHEFGHHFGIMDLAVSDLAVMSASGDWHQTLHVLNGCLTEADAEGLCHAVGCSPSPRMCGPDQ